MDRCSSFTSHSCGEFRCFSIQKASVEDFGSIGNGLAVTAWVKEAKNDDRRENGQAGRKNRTCHWWDERDWSCYRETLRSGRSIRPWLLARDCHRIASTALPRPPCAHSPGRGQWMCGVAAFG